MVYLITQGFTTNIKTELEEDRIILAPTEIQHFLDTDTNRSLSYQRSVHSCATNIFSFLAIQQEIYGQGTIHNAGVYEVPDILCQGNWAVKIDLQNGKTSIFLTKT